MMGWKNWSYWLKGVLIFILAYPVLASVCLLIGIPPNIILLPILPLMYLESFVGKLNNPWLMFAIIVLIMAGMLMIIGAVVGGIYGKKKNRE